MPPGYKRSRALWDEARRPGASKMAYMRAVCYELQPIRFASVDAGAWRAYMHQYGIKARHILTETFPTAARAFWEFLLRMSSQGWMIVGGALTYCYAIRYIHE